MVYENRKYRSFMRGEGLVSFQVMVKETDLWISAELDLSEKALALARTCRRQIEHCILNHPAFLTSLEPVEVSSEAPPIIQEMALAARVAGVGPMAAVAGAVAEFVGHGLLDETAEVIVENGGDIFLASKRERTVSIYAGDSPFSHRIGIRIPSESTPVGICTSSGLIGHSLSLGKTHAVTVLSSSTALADAVATAAGNRVRSPRDIQAGLDFMASLDGVKGGVVIVGESMGAWGDLELVDL